MPEKVCIIGFGRLGETLAGILKDFYEISVVDESAGRLEQAKRLGYSAISLADLTNCKTIFICVPINKFESVVKKASQFLAPGTLVMDVCSVKVFPTEVMQAHLPKTVSIIATHPLFGPDSIKKSFNKLTMVTYPVRVSDDLYAKWNNFWKNLGLNLIVASPQVHDQATAYTLGMTHFFGRIMDELHLQPQAITTISYGALYEVMRQANHDSWELFHDMQHYNPYAKDMRESVYQAIEKVEKKLNDALD